MLAERASVALFAVAASVFILFEPQIGHAQDVLDESILENVEGGRWGISVRTLNGEPVLAVNADQRFATASSMKLVTSAAALHYLGEFSNGGWPRGTAVYISQEPGSALPSIMLEGSGDATLSNSAACLNSCLAQLANAVRAHGVTQIENIVVDDTLFEPPHWPAGWAHEDLRFAYGTAVSALVVDDASASARVSPGPSVGDPPLLEWSAAPAFPIDISRAETSRYGFGLEFRKLPDSSGAEITGTIGLNAGRVPLKFGLEDPSIYAGKLFRSRLAEEGISILGDVVRADKVSSEATSGLQPRLIVRQPPPTPRKTLEAVLKKSNNVHSEVLLHHISLTFNDRTAQSGRELLEHLMLQTGASEDDFHIEDGSGLSFYNRMTPDAMSGLLSWSASQPWFDLWKDLLAANGDDGTLEYRLSRGLQDGRVRAKTGTMFGANALAGYVKANSGQEYAFTIFLNDSALSHSDARSRIDAIVRALIEQL